MGDGTLEQSSEESSELEGWLRQWAWSADWMQDGEDSTWPSMPDLLLYDWVPEDNEVPDSGEFSVAPLTQGKETT